MAWSDRRVPTPPDHRLPGRAAATGSSRAGPPARERARLAPIVNPRVLVVDDMPSIHADFAKILGTPQRPRGLAELEQGLFGAPVGAGAPEPAPIGFELEFASQGLEGVERFQRALARGAPHALAFVDVRMPPGLDGIETVVRLWALDPRLEIVICTAYSDYTWQEMLARLSRAGQFLVLGKPFDSTAVRQMALALTEKWALARAAERKRAELDALVEERTRSLREANDRLGVEMGERLAVERKLLHAQKLEALGRLVAGVAHELQGPLSLVLANLDHVAQELAALEASLGERVRELRFVAEEAHVGGRRIHHLVEDLTSVRPPDRPAPEPVAVGEVLAFALRMAGPSLPPEARVQSEIAPVAPVRASPGELSQVFLNLLVNAGRAVRGLPAARQRITAELAPLGDRVRATVRDTGVGIPDAVLPRVFDPFFTTRDHGEGTGLGLSICHGIVQRLGGEIRIESREGEGTSVHVLLPAAEVSASGPGGRA
jgi:signal transduction histidine kinase